MNVILPTGWKAVANGESKHESSFDEGKYVAQCPAATESQGLLDHLEGRSGFYYIFN